MYVIPVHGLSTVIEEPAEITVPSAAAIAEAENLRVRIVERLLRVGAKFGINTTASKEKATVTRNVL